METGNPGLFTARTVLLQAFARRKPYRYGVSSSVSQFSKRSLSELQEKLNNSE
jgi:hypothetical protein